MISRDFYIKELPYILIIIILFIIAYYPILNWMYIRYTGADTYYSHGFLIPFISAFLIWKERQKLRQNGIRSSSWWGMLFIIISVFLHIAGTILYIFSLSGISIFFFIVGATLFLLGERIFKIMTFSLLYLLFMFPLPEAFLTRASFPLKMMVARFSAIFVSIMGIPIFREGFYISIPEGTLIVDNPCSGLRSLISFLALGAIYAYFLKASGNKKCLLFLGTIPIALFCNTLRVIALVSISHCYGLAAAAPDTFVHTASGLLVFIFGFLLLSFGGRLIESKNST